MGLKSDLVSRKRCDGQKSVVTVDNQRWQPIAVRNKWFRVESRCAVEITDGEKVGVETGGSLGVEVMSKVANRGVPSDPQASVHIISKMIEDLRFQGEQDDFVVTSH